MSADVTTFPLWEDFPWLGWIPPGLEVRKGKVDGGSVLVIRDVAREQHCDLLLNDEDPVDPTFLPRFLQPMLNCLTRSGL